jgi:homeodomain-containing protein
MATPRPPRVVLSKRERADLERVVRAYTTGQQVALRARIVLLAGDGWNNLQIARELSIDDETPGHWRRRWLHFPDVPLEEFGVAERLADGPRPGAPAKFTPEQVCQIIALACEKPADSGRPISQWSHRELADEIVRRGIVGSISARHAGRLLKRSRSQTAPDSVLVHPPPTRRPKSALSGSLTSVPCTAKRCRVSQMANVSSAQMR